MRLLILGGTTEASALAAVLARDASVEATLSLAGRTSAPVLPAIKTRVGGFGGARGLAAFLYGERPDAVIDATHPFAARMSANAVAACGEARVPLAVFSRPPWRPEADDRWTQVPDMASAAAALGSPPRRVFLTVGRLALAAFAVAPKHRYLIRTIDAVGDLSAFPRHRLLRARGPFRVEDEIALIRAEQIDCLITKNSGGDATRAKLDAARALGLEVIMVTRPPASGAERFERLADVLAWIAGHRSPP